MIRYAKVIIEAEREHIEAFVCDFCGWSCYPRGAGCPQGWYHVAQATEYTHESLTGDFCSLNCLLKGVQDKLTFRAIHIVEPLRAFEKILRKVNPCEHEARGAVVSSECLNLVHHLCSRQDCDCTCHCPYKVSNVDRYCAHKESWFCCQHHQKHCPVCDKGGKR